MPIQTEVYVDDDVLDEWGNLLVRLPALAKGAIQRQTRSLKRRIIAELTDEPGSPSYPYVWSLDPDANARARRYYFGVILKGKKTPGGRYRRTGKLLEAWDVKANYSRDFEHVEITMENAAAGAEYVQGRFQIYGHIRTGWPNADEIAIKYSEIATEEFIDMWFTLADPFGGVTP